MHREQAIRIQERLFEAGMALDRCKELGISSSHEVLAARLQALAEADGSVRSG